MKETILWQAKPSLLLYWLRYILCLALSTSWLLLPQNIKGFEFYKGIRLIHIAGILSLVILLPAITGFFQLLCTRYVLTDERIFIYSGILNREREEIELYRIKDYKVFSPIYIRIFGLSNLTINTSDKTMPVLIFYAISDSYRVADLLREQVEIKRNQKGVREFD